ncbi:hypothetical protein QR680_009645 [Steinernema hermaphroditum]|uniref:G-protein coupled receptors family 1 profile domain-containing protein n=1 Tax=Steinernema hermaphroditum TaxID=289476 RepID=A0AA39MAA3_9BILA|nr:hypothetical protein QR680_009645 [Steinernema hermaphroditum]
MLSHINALIVLLLTIVPQHFGEHNVTFDDYDMEYLDTLGFLVANDSSIISSEPNPQLPVALLILLFAAFFYAVNVWIVANLVHSRSFVELRTTTVLLYLALASLLFSTILLPLFIYSVFDGSNVLDYSSDLCYFQANALVFWRAVTGISQMTIAIFHLYAVTVIRAHSSLPTPTDLSGDVGVVASLYIIISVLALLVLIPDIFLIKRTVAYDYRGHHCLYLPYSNGIYSVTFGNSVCGVILPVSTSILILIGIARIKRNGPFYRMLNEGRLFNALLIFVCLLQVDLPFPAKQASLLETLNVFRLYAICLLLPFLYYVLYSLEEIDFKFVQLYGATFQNGSIHSPDPNPLYGLSYFLTVFSAIALGGNIGLIVYNGPQKKCTAWISQFMVTVVAWVHILGIFLVVLPFIYNLSTGSDVFRGCYLCCQAHTYLAAALRGGLFLMSLFIIHQFCAEKHDVSPNPPRVATEDQKSDRRCKSFTFLALPLVASGVLFPDLSFVHDPVYDYRFHHCVSPPWNALEISQFPVGAFAYPALFYYYWMRLLRHCVANRVWISVKPILLALLIFFFYPCTYIPYLAISQYGTPHFDRSWIPAAAIALTYIDVLVNPFVYATLVVYSKRRIFPNAHEEEGIELT